MFSINMLNGLFDPIINWFSAFLYYICVGLYYIIICGIGKIVDIIQILFRKFAGLDDMSLAGQEGDIVLQFINSNIVQKVFWAMVVLAVVLLFIASFVAVIKTEFNKDGKNDKKKVIKNAFRGIVNFLAVPIVCIFGLIVGNALLRAIDGALTLTGNSLSMTSQIFAAGGYNANRVRSYEGTGDNAEGYAENSMAYYIATGYGNFGIFTEDTTGVVKQSIADKIDSAFANNLTVDLTQLSKDQKTLVYAGGKNGDYLYSYLNMFTLGAFPGGHTKFNKDEYVDGNRVVIIGDGSGAIQESTTKLTFSIYNIGLVSYYYNLSLASYDYLVAVIALIFAAWTYLVTILGLIKRLFMLTTLFIISPPICALYPLDEGTALGKWRKAFIGQALSAYSVVIVMNIFFLLLPLMLQIEIIPLGAKVQIWDVGAGFVNYFARVLIVIGALTFFKDATKTIAELIGAENAYGDGASAASNFAKNVGRVAAGVALGPGAAKAAGKFVSKTANGLVNSVDKMSKNKMNKDSDKQAQKDAIEEQQNQSGELPGGTDTNGKGFSNSEGASTSKSGAPTSTSSAKPTKNKAKANKNGLSKGAKVTKGILKGLGIAAVGIATGPAGLAVMGAAKGISKLGKTKFGRAVKGGVASFARGTGRVFKTMGAIAAGKASIKMAFNAVSGKGKAWEDFGYTESQIKARKSAKELQGQINSTKEELSGLENVSQDYQSQMKDYENQMKDYENQMNDVKSKMRGLNQSKNQYHKLNKQLMELSGQYDEITNKHKEVERLYNDTEREAKILEEKLDRLKK